MSKEKEWFTNRVTFIYLNGGGIRFQELNDDRSCRDWLKQDYDYSDEMVDAVTRGHIIKGEISFFTGKNYGPIDKKILSAMLLRVIEKHDEVFGKCEILIGNGKEIRADYYNWPIKEELGYWKPVPMPICWDK